MSRVSLGLLEPMLTRVTFGTRPSSQSLSFFPTAPNPAAASCSAGSSNSTDQSIFSIAADTWLNLRTGVVSGLNTTETGPALYTFDPSLDGQYAGVVSGGQVVGARQVCQHTDCLYAINLALHSDGSYHTVVFANEYHPNSTL